jgi:hypothetical protein
MNEAAAGDTMIVTIPAMDNHGGFAANTVTVKLHTRCPLCGAKRSAPWKALSYDGSQRMEVDTWAEGCGHYAYYSGARLDAQQHGLNPGYSGQAGYDVRSVAAVADVIEAGDYVRVNENVDMGHDQDLIYLRDIQAVHRVVRVDDTIVVIETTRGRYAMMAFQVYLVDVAALAGEMADMIAEEAAEQAEVVEHSEAAMNDIVASLRVTADEPKPLVDRVVEMYEARLADYARECERFRARIAQLEAKLTPFARAALDENVRGRNDDKALLYIHRTGFVGIEVDADSDELLEVRHLNDALEVLPNVANGGSDSQ